jgi:Peptidase C13 family
MDPSKDVLVVALASHGGPDGLAVTAGRRAGLLAPATLKAMLDASGATYRIVIVSACYSGVFARELAAPRTLVITAAAADRPSFGCQDGATWTYFGDAFYNQALRRQASLDAAFAEAKRLVTEREQGEGFTPSNPQIAGGAEVLSLLARR